MITITLENWKEYHGFPVYELNEDRTPKQHIRGILVGISPRQPTFDPPFSLIIDTKTLGHGLQYMTPEYVGVRKSDNSVFSSPEYYRSTVAKVMDFYMKKDEKPIEPDRFDVKEVR